MKLRDRDAIITKEGLIFRVFGYAHPLDAYFCDVEYAPATLFKSNNPKASRGDQHTFYKFYEDEGWKLIQNKFTQHLIFHQMLQREIIGVAYDAFLEVRKPEEKLNNIFTGEPKDELTCALQNAVKTVIEYSVLSSNDFGVFGSILHGFHHPKLSDIDLTIYGQDKIIELRETLHEFYGDTASPLMNEFETNESIKGKYWRFRNITPKEFVRHQRRKLIYAKFRDPKSGRTIKTEFEPVRDWREISNDYDVEARIVQKGWVKMLARVTDDADSPFMPSIYIIEPLKILGGSKNAIETKRVISYMEEFRMQACKDETVYVEGNLEEVTNHKGSFYQIALTYCPRYYEQTLKAAFLSSNSQES